ncbi:putative nuclease HARBI1 [Heteronotia binoei]|uniref:putative nuclease HARBI1 n=1 Tax=Heteronotia binoei TaxID=13085 RepID=UPI00293101AB|nr:putative nuclease HARBI1 [Heteronotia binoei]
MRALDACRYRECLSTLHFEDATCLDCFRLDHIAIQDLCEQVRASLCSQVASPQPIPILLHILISLRFLATGSLQGMVAEVLEVSQSSATHCLHSFLDAMPQHLQQHVWFPRGEEELRTAGVGFASVVGFPNVVGAVDCMHVTLVAPREDPMVYRKRNHFYSFSVQTSCDHRGVFTDLVAKFPGSVHDAQIFMSSGFNHLLAARPDGQGWLLGKATSRQRGAPLPSPVLTFLSSTGDRGYSLLPYLLTPYQEDAPEDWAEYYQVYRATCMDIDCAFGQLKMRFCCLQHIDGQHRMQPLPVAKLVAVCVMLHNITARQCLPAPQDLPLPNPGSPMWENVEAAAQATAQQDFGGHLNQECVRAHIWATGRAARAPREESVP